MDVSIYFHRRKKKKRRENVLEKHFRRGKRKGTVDQHRFPYSLFSSFPTFRREKKSLSWKKQRKNSVESVGSGPQKQRVQKFFFIPLSFRRPKKVGRDGFHSFSPPPPPRNPHFLPLLLFIIVMGRAHHLLLLSLYYKPRHQRGHTSIQKDGEGPKRSGLEIRRSKLIKSVRGEM